MNISICASGGGGNARYLLEHQEGFKVKQLIIDRECKALDLANDFRIPLSFIKGYGPNIHRFVNSNIDLVVLAGYMPIVDEESCKKLKIINTHPSLLPKHGGKGMYGVKVQEAVLAAKDKQAGCTVHWVDAGIDTGKTIVQKRLDVVKTESAWDLGGRIFKMEGPALIEAIHKIKKEITK